MNRWGPGAHLLFCDTLRVPLRNSVLRRPSAVSVSPGLCFISEMEFDLDKALEEVPIHIEDPPFPSFRPEKRSSGLISELPSEEGKKLEHFTKLRPKRNKKQQPTQAAVGGREGPLLPLALSLPGGRLEIGPGTWPRVDVRPPTVLFSAWAPLSEPVVATC